MKQTADVWGQQINRQCLFPAFSSVDLQVVEVVQRGAQSPAWLHVVHFLGQLGGGEKKKNNTKSLKCLLYLLK